MKNLLLKITAVTIIIFNLNSCKSWSVVSDDGNVICSNYQYDPIYTLDKDFMNHVTQKYSDNHGFLIENGLPKKQQVVDPDFKHTEAVTYPIEELKRFLNQIETVTKQHNNDITSAELGVRIYYITYPSKSDWADYNDLTVFIDDKDEMQLRHSLMFVPTIYDPKLGMMRDFDPRFTSTYEGENSSTSTNGFAMMLSVRNLDANAKNHGGMIPPGSKNGNSH